MRVEAQSEGDLQHGKHNEKRHENIPASLVGVRERGEKSKLAQHPFQRACILVIHYEGQLYDILSPFRQMNSIPPS